MAPTSQRSVRSGRSSRAPGADAGPGNAPVPPAFAGFPVTAFDFYDDLEADNSKTFWDAHKDAYTSAVRAPMLALMAALEGEFGPAKVFRPYRDVRFAKDRTPYKTNQGAFVAAGPATGWYLEIAAPGFRVAGGFYHAEPAGIAAVRTAIDGPDGAGLERIVGRLRRAGWKIEGDRVKTVPRGFSAEHPRIELLRYKWFTASKDYGFDPVIQTPELAARVRHDWRALRPLVEWLAARLEGTG